MPRYFRESCSICSTALTHYYVALGLTQQSNARLSESAALLGRYADAIAAYQQALMAQQAHGQQMLHTLTEGATVAFTQARSTDAFMVNMDRLRHVNYKHPTYPYALTLLRLGKYTKLAYIMV